jgi:molybdenum cofactor cytidylyltransferase
MNSAAGGIGCIVLAAGRSRRFGSDKRLQRLPSGRTLLEETVAVVEPLFVHRVLVLRPGDEKLAEAFHSAWHVVQAEDADRGMGHSLAAALAHCADWQGAVIALADMPWVAASTHAAVRDALSAERLVVPCFGGERGNPVGIGRAFFPTLRRPAGDTGARELFKSRAAEVLHLEVADPGILRDLDVPGQDCRWEPTQAPKKSPA